MKNKYYTPDIEDLRVGYECEVNVPIRVNNKWIPSGYIMGTITSIVPHFEWQDYQKTCHTFGKNFKIEFRVPFLTKEQIETEGWQVCIVDEDLVNPFSAHDNNNSSNTITGNKLGYVIEYFEDHKMQIWDYESNTCIFFGECKDINIFRWLCKLLKI